ncbi:response regulator receiver modulated diguanylate cyclase [Thermincola ferriacetica]|uniref:Stage 0 sporulation protein A homolog n=1 Tax=Thermincola ferriacetica TaxID=281456 RepID=A0A0L6W562_9FIRM|nr:diguanylate cyclase [Thermincola ferriacetica]KNZ70670.1 response regulator receiver modulated diguanylate cyclase [Thermincola ferriacetica]
MQETKNHILIVEDNPLTANQLKSFLETVGYKVSLCLNAEQARNFLTEETPDLIILDIILPDTDGYELCRWIREETRLRLIPIIFVSAKDGLDDKVLGLQAGGDDYITKPFAMEELLARIEVILQRMRVFHELSMRDELTGSYNRRYFNERLTEEVHRVKRYGRPLTVAMIDIDHFKQVNDTYGHQVGDFVLTKLVEFLQNNLRKSDLVARFGGEEFVVLLTEIDADSAERLMERIRSALENATFIYNREPLFEKISVKITVSIGLASCPKDATDPERIISLADEALYIAKNTGRNRIVKHC